MSPGLDGRRRRERARDVRLCKQPLRGGLSSTTKTDAIPLHESTYGPLPQAVRTFIHSTLERGTPDGPIHEIDVYGPGSRSGS